MRGKEKQREKNTNKQREEMFLTAAGRDNFVDKEIETHRNGEETHSHSYKGPGGSDRERENTQEGTHRRIERKNMNLSRTYAGLGEREEERRGRESVEEIFKEQKTG